MMDKKGLIGLMKGTTGMIFIASFVLLVALFFVFPIFAAHSTTIAVVPTTVNPGQTVTLNFSVTQGGANAISNISINFSQAGWALPANDSVACPSSLNASSVLWNATVAGGTFSCKNTTATGIDGPFLDDGNTTYMAVKTSVAPDGNGTATTFNVTTTDDAGATYSANVTVTILPLSANITVNDTTAQTDARKSYTFTVTNNGTDAIKNVYLDYTNWTNDTEAGNVTCLTTSAIWTKSVDTTNKRIGCYADSGQTSLAAGASKTITVSSWDTLDAAGVKIFALTVTGDAGGNYTEQLNNANITVFGTASTTTLDNASTTQAINSNLVDVLRINITADGEQINVTSINIALSGTALEADIQSVMIYNETLSTGGARMSHIATNATRLGAAGGNVTINFGGSGWVIPANSSNLTRVIVNITAAATGGRTFTGNITAAANITMSGFASKQTITTSGSFPAFANTTTIFGNLSLNTTNTVVTGNTIALANSANFTTLHINLTANGEQMNAIDLAINTTATTIGDLTLRVYNDTGCDGGNVVTSSDFLINSTSGAPAATQTIRLGNASYNVSIPAGVTKCYFVAYNVSVDANGGDTFQTLLAGNNATATGASSAQAITSYGADGQQSVAAEIQGNLTVNVTDRSTGTVVIGSVNYSTIQVNLTSGGENITDIIFTINSEGSASDSNSLSAVMIAVDNNTNGLYDGPDTDLIVNTSTTVTGAIHLVNASLNQSIAANSNVSYIILYDIAATGGGDVFTTTIAASNITATGGVSNNTITGIGTGGNSSLTTIFGNFSVDGFNITAGNVNTNRTSFPLLKLNFTSTAENMSIEQINITLNATDTNDITAARLYNDTNNNSVLDASEPLVGTATLSGNVAAFGTPGTNFFNAPNGTVVGMILVVDINESAAGQNTIDAHIVAAANITVVSNQSAQTITPLGSYSIDPEGFATVKALSATGNASVTSRTLNSQGTITFIINNTADEFGGDSIDQILINYTNWVNDTETANVTCPTFLSVTWNKTVDTTNNLIVCNSTGPGQILDPGNSTNPNATITVSNWVAPNTAGSKTIPVIVRGNRGNGTENITNTLEINVTGTVAMAFADKATSTVQINSSDYNLAMINITPSGESVNNPVLSLNLTSVSGNVTALTIYNNTGCDGSTLGDVVLVNTTSAALNGTASHTINRTLAPGQNTCFIAAVNVSVDAQGGNTVQLAMAAADITATGLTSSATLTASGNNSLASTAAEIYGNVTIASANIAPTAASSGQDGVAMLYLNITALGEALNITSINITANGTANQTNLSTTNGVRIYNDTNGNLVFNAGTDLNLSTANTTINGTGASQSANLTLINTTNGDEFIVPKGATRTIFVVYNISGNAQNGSTIGATVARANDVHIVGSTSGIEINPLSGVPVASTNTTITSAAALSVSSITITPTNVSAGQNRIQAVVKIQNTGNTTANITLVNLTFHRNASTANQTDTANYTIEAANTTSPATITGGSTTDYNITFNISSTAALGIVYINATVTGVDANTGAALDTAGAVATVDSFNVESQANISVGAITASHSWLAAGLASAVNETINITIPLTNNGNSSATSFGRTIALLNSTGGNINSSFNITQIDTNTSASGYAATTHLTYNITINNGSFNGPVNFTFTLAYNDNNTGSASVESTDTNFTSALFTVDSTSPTIALVLPTNQTAQTTATLLTVNATFNDTVNSIAGIGLNNSTAGFFRISNFTYNSSWTAMTTNLSATAYGGTLNLSSLVDNGGVNVYNISLNVTDILGNQNTTLNMGQITVDFGATPNITFDQPANTVFTSSTPTVTFNTTEAAVCRVSNSTTSYDIMTIATNGTNTTTHNYTYSTLLDKSTYTYYFACKDIAGNQEKATYSFGVDTRGNFNITRPEALGDYWSAAWHDFSLPKVFLENTSLTNYNVTNVLSSVSSYDHLQAYNGTGWQTYVPGRAVNSFINFSYNGTNSYWIHTTAADQRIEIN